MATMETRPSSLPIAPIRSTLSSSPAKIRPQEPATPNSYSSLQAVLPEDLDTGDGCDFDKLRNHPEWSYWRILCAKVLASQKFEISMGMVTLSNILPIIMETDVVVECENKSSSDCDQSLLVLKIVNNVFLFVYTVELLARVFLYRKRFRKVLWNNFDALIVVVGILGEIAAGLLPRLAALRIFRVARLVRLVRLFVSFRELYLIVSGVFSVAKTIFWAAILLMLLLCVLSILAVEYLNPANRELQREGMYSTCSWCGRAFSSVWTSNITLFLFVIVGDAWGLVAVPLMEKTPLATAILLTCVLIVSLGFSNLIMAVIVEKAIESRSDDEQYVLILQAQEDERLRSRFMKFCRDLDTDKSGQISLQELLSNWKRNRKFASALQSMRIDDETDLTFCFHVMDVDRSGSVSYEEFGNAILRMKTMNVQKHMLFLEHRFTNLAFDVHTMQREMREGFNNLSKRADELSERMISQTQSCKAEVKPETDSEGIPASLLQPARFTGTDRGEADDFFQCVRARMSQMMDSIAREASAQENAMNRNLALLNNLSELASPLVAKSALDATNLPSASPFTPVAAEPVILWPAKGGTAPRLEKDGVVWGSGKATHSLGRTDDENMWTAPPAAPLTNAGCQVRTRDASQSLRACGCGE